MNAYNLSEFSSRVSNQNPSYGYLWFGERLYKNVTFHCVFRRPHKRDMMSCLETFNLDKYVLRILCRKVPVV